MSKDKTDETLMDETPVDETPVDEIVEPEPVIVLPRTLYKPGGRMVCRHDVHYSELLVRTPEEMKAAMKEGWLDSFGDALKKAEAQKGK